MKRLNLSRCALSVCVAAVSFAGCGGSQGPVALSSLPSSSQPGNAALPMLGAHVFPMTYTFTKYEIPTKESDPNEIAAGPGNALWFTEEAFQKSQIGRVTTDGVFTEFKLTRGSEPSHVVADVDKVWFTERGYKDIGFVTPAGAITYYAADSTTRGITRNTLTKRIWFTEFKAGNVAKIDATTGQIKSYHVPTQGAGPYDIVFSTLSGDLWFTELTGSKIGRVTNRGAFAEYPTPGEPQGLAFGPGDKYLWFTETSTSKIGRMSMSGSVREYATPTKQSEPIAITLGPDRALWFTEYNASKIGRITLGGKITEIDTPDPNAQPVGITTGPDNNIWFVEHAANAIVKITL